MEPNPEVLGQVAAHVFEESAFVMLAPRAPGGSRPEQPVCASIAFTGEQLRGTLGLCVDAGIALEAAASMLALEPGELESEHSGSAAIAEILNIMAGALAEQLVGTQRVCPIGIPLVHASSEPPPGGEPIAVELEDMEGRALYVEFRAAAAGLG